MSDEIERLEREMSAASDNLKKNSSPSAEKRYGQAYSALVKANARRPLRSKYRGGVK